MSAPDPTRIWPSGICRRGYHEWRHEPEGGKRLMCDRCRSMSMVNYTDGACRPDCADHNPPARGEIGQ